MIPVGTPVRIVDPNTPDQQLRGEVDGYYVTPEGETQAVLKLERTSTYNVPDLGVHITLHVVHPDWLEALDG